MNVVGETDGSPGSADYIPGGPLQPPANLAARSGDSGEIVLTCTDLVDTTITRYQFRHRSSEDTGWNLDWTDVPNSAANTTTHMLIGLTNYLVYAVQVRTVCDPVNGPERSITDAPRGPLVAQPSFAAQSGKNRSVILTWDSTGDNSITEHQYRYCFSTSDGWNPDWTQVTRSEANTVSYQQTGLTTNNEYTSEIRAMRGADAGPVAEANATPIGPPTAPAALTIVRPHRRPHGVLLRMGVRAKGRTGPVTS